MTSLFVAQVPQGTALGETIAQCIASNEMGTRTLDAVSHRDSEDAMIITRYEHQVEFEIEGQRKVSIDVRRVRGAALSSERSGSRVVNALVLLMEAGSGATAGEQRIEGGAVMLAAVHQTVIEAMTELAEEADGKGSSEATPLIDPSLHRYMH